LQRQAIAAPWLDDDVPARRASALSGTVARAAVDDDHLVDALSKHGCHHRPDGFFLLEAGNDGADHGAEFCRL
jgi:hypothetical protein